MYEKHHLFFLYTKNAIYSVQPVMSTLLCMYVCVHVCVCVRVYVCVCMCHITGCHLLLFQMTLGDAVYVSYLALRDCSNVQNSYR